MIIAFLKNKSQGYFKKTFNDKTYHILINELKFYTNSAKNIKNNFYSIGIRKK